MKTCELSRTFANFPGLIRSESSQFADSLYIGKKKGGWRRFANQHMVVRFLLGVALGVVGAHVLVVSCEVFGW